MNQYVEIDFLPGYFACVDGNIYSKNNRSLYQFRKLKGYKFKNGYTYFKIKKEEKYLNFARHRLICYAFHGKQPINHECSHLDDNKDNDLPSNLSWHTRKENLKIREKIRGGWRGGLKHGRKKFNESQINEIKKLISENVMGTEIAKKFGCTKSTIYEIKRGQTYK